MRPALALGTALLLLAGCDGAKPVLREDKAQTKNTGFPAADRPVATIVSTRWSTEEARDRLNEAGQVMNLAGIKPGMTVQEAKAVLPDVLADVRIWVRKVNNLPQ